MNRKPSKFSPEVRARAVRPVAVATARRAFWPDGTARDMAQGEIVFFDEQNVDGMAGWRPCQAD